MPRITSSFVKNIVRRGLREVIDSEPKETEKALLWEHFNNRCAYCGTELNRAKREGRIDHAVSTSQGGHNGLGNRVLACGPCNDDEKLAEHWDAFLRRKNHDTASYHERHQRIIQWMSKQVDGGLSPEIIAAAYKAGDEVNRLIDAKIVELKRLMRQV